MTNDTPTSQPPLEKDTQQTTTVEAQKVETKAKVYELPASATTMQIVDALLKSPESIVNQIKTGEFTKTLFILLGVFISCHALYGVIVGSFSGNVQWFAAPIKIVGGAMLSALLCYPSLYIFSCLSGANVTPGQVFSLLMGGLALVSLLLLGFAPVAFIFTFSIKGIEFMGFVHLMIWSISIYFGLRYIMTGLEFLDSRKDTWFINLWAIIFIMTLLQMTTTLRPILGESDVFLTQEKLFFVEHWINELDDRK